MADTGAAGVGVDAADTAAGKRGSPGTDVGSVLFGLGLKYAGDGVLWSGDDSNAGVCCEIAVAVDAGLIVGLAN